MPKAMHKTKTDCPAVNSPLLIQQLREQEEAFWERRQNDPDFERLEQERRKGESRIGRDKLFAQNASEQGARQEKMDLRLEQERRNREEEAHLVRMAQFETIRDEENR